MPRLRRDETSDTRAGDSSSIVDNTIIDDTQQLKLQQQNFANAFNYNLSNGKGQSGL